MANPLKAIMDVRRKELPLALLMFSYFFLVITTFWVLKPIKKTEFIRYYKTQPFSLGGWHLNGSQAELLAKVMNMVVAFLAVVAFTWLARTMRRQQLTYVFSAFCGLCLAVFAGLVGVGGEATVWALYLFGDLYNTLMVATFFAFLNDSFSPQAAKRTYGLIILGGVSGGAFGSMWVRVQINSLGVGQWLWVCLGLTALIVLVARQAGRLVAKSPPPEKQPAPAAPAEARSNAAVEGARLVAKSRYLLAIVTIVAIYEIVSTLLDFQFTRTVEVLSTNVGEHFTTVYAITNVSALVIQLLLTSFVMTRFGVRTALLVMPIAVVAVSGGYLALPILWMGSLLSMSDNGLNYSLNQSAREALYTPTSRDEKYKAKAFIDMFVQRFAKALAVGVALIVSSIFASFEGIRYLSIITIACTLVWIYAATYAGRRFQELTEEPAGD